MAVEYVVGFLIDDANEEVALIQKIKPAWQAGKLNGIGGKIEPGESALAAMIREFKEETGAIDVTQWRLFAMMNFPDGVKVHCFESRQVDEIQTTTEEEVGWYNLDGVKGGEYETIPNLPWLVGMAHDKDKVYSEIYYSFREA